METQEMKLFTAHSTMNLQFGDNWWEDVPIAWYADREEPPFPYDQVIQIDNHDESDPLLNYPRHYVNGLFTEQEARSLVAYLEAGGVGVDLYQVDLPISDIEIGVWMKPFSPSREGHISLAGNVGYNLPFKINGFFQLEHSKTWQEMSTSSDALLPVSEFAQRLWEAIGSEDLDISRLNKALEELEEEGWEIISPEGSS